MSENKFSISALIDEAISSKQQLLYTFVPTLLILITCVLVGIAFDIPMNFITMDMLAVAQKIPHEINPFHGILSNLGAFLWCGTATVCFFQPIYCTNLAPRINTGSRYTLARYLLIYFGRLFHVTRNNK